MVAGSQSQSSAVGHSGNGTLNNCPKASCVLPETHLCLSSLPSDQVALDASGFLKAPTNICLCRFRCVLLTDTPSELKQEEVVTWPIRDTVQGTAEPPRYGACMCRAERLQTFPKPVFFNRFHINYVRVGTLVSYTTEQCWTTCLHIVTLTPHWVITK